MLNVAKLAIKFVMQRRLRSILTTLGIAIGVALVFSLVSLNAGMSAYITDELEQMGSDMLIIMPKFQMGGGMSEPLTDDNLELIQRLPFVNLAAGMGTAVLPVEIKGDEQYRSVMGMGGAEMDEIFRDMQNFKIERGRFIDDAELGKIVIGYLIAKDNKLSPGSQILIDGKKFRVSGIIAEVGNPEDDNSIIMSAEALWDITDNYGEYMIFFAKVSEMKPERVAQVLERARGREDFDVMTPESMLEMVNQILGAVSAVFLAVASISILVGSIGVANTMYVSVLERTREIGIMKSIGAKNNQILQLFLIEAGFLGLVGGTSGVIFGYGIAELFSYFAATQGIKALQPIITPGLFLISAGLSFVIGILSGLFPARWASRLQPVEALRYE
ncbi:MAG: ABC transporter permease [Candidatus Altiarchaeota archaeon]|nr:ABC transporter permease [Candidatus Altiarchaeota archaeon]